MWKKEELWLPASCNIRQHCYAQDIDVTTPLRIARLHREYRIEAVKCGVITPITPDIRGVRFEPHARRAIIHLFLRARCCLRTIIALAPMIPRADLHSAYGPDGVGGPTSIFVPDDAGD